MANCIAILNKLHIFWRHSNCPVHFKLQALNAVVRTKLLYGLESAQLNQTTINKLNAFHMKGLRKILHMQTTFGVMQEGTDRQQYSNSKAIETANRKLQEEGHTKIR